MTTTFPPSSTSPPPVTQIGAIAWLRKNLFSSWFNSILTLVLGYGLISSTVGFVRWATTIAQWQVVSANLALYFAGRYPANQYWRLWALVGLIAALAGVSWGILGRNAVRLFSPAVLVGSGLVALLILLIPISMSLHLTLLILEGLVLAGAWIGRIAGRANPELGGWLSFAWVLTFVVGLWLLLGGLGLPVVSTTNWGGLLLTLFMSVVSIVLSFPFGVLFAIGRQSNLPVIRGLATIYIELIRGLPLVTILFFASVMVPLFLPAGNFRIDLVLRAIIGLTLFTAAYLAEAIRGGLQAIPRGQTEASRALGLNTPLTLFLIVLPQALKVSIPAIVGQFISLLQDTTLVLIIGLFELLGITRSVLANPNFIGRYAESYLFIGLVFWVFCYAMSLGSRALENKLNTSR